MKVAIFGGTFDPIHRGHIYLAEEIIKIGNFDRLIVVPAGSPWQRPAVAHSSDRLEMARRAFERDDVVVSDCEVRRNSPSYALDTVKELKRESPDSDFTWIIGSDALSGLASWHQIMELADLVEFLVIIRPGFEITPDRVPEFISWRSLEIGALDISATEIRRALHEHRDVSSMIAPEVLRYIKEKKLYGAA